MKLMKNMFENCQFNIINILDYLNRLRNSNEIFDLF